MTKRLTTLIIGMVIAVTTSPVSYADTQLIECRQVENVIHRLACYDEWVDKTYAEPSQAGVGSSAPSSSNPKVDARGTVTKIEQAPPGADADQFGKPVVATNRPQEISARITELSKTAHNKLRTTLDNQQVWLQLDSSRMHLRSGDVVTIRASSLGSFQLRKEGGGKSIRVKRVK